ncbi:MAG: hypothetical protein L0312_12720 [Acidobacteria bacterium]|nr:hypothetical protein [Acidobacteriota bacterium]
MDEHKATLQSRMLMMLAVLLFVVGLWHMVVAYYESRKEAIVRETIAKAVDACQTRDATVIARAKVEALSSIRDLPQHKRQEFHSALDNGLRLVFCE